jgi:ABC-2 type transport system permease protein
MPIENSSPPRGVRTLVSLTGAYLRTSLQGLLEYRASFVTRVVSMLCNDAAWLAMWLLFYQRFPLIEGWGPRQVVTIWAVSAGGYGLATTVCGGMRSLAADVMLGRLDPLMTLPRPILPHILIRRMEPTALGDVAFGVLGFLVLANPTLMDVGLFTIFLLSTAAIYVVFAVLTQSVVFWVENSENLAEQLLMALITFSLQPTMIFDGWVKAALFTVIPAGFIAFVPLRLLTEFSWPLLGGLLAFAAGILVIASAVFHAGLKRYESGNLIGGQT